MKKTLLLLLCMAMLTGCSDSNTAPDEKASSESSDVTAEDSASPVADCEWEDNSHSYKTEAEFLSEGVAKMGYYNDDTKERQSITPYTVDYDEEKYELIQITAIAEYEYFYILRNKETKDKITVSFFYEDNISTIDDVYGNESTQRVNVAFGGTSDTTALLANSGGDESLILIPGEDCQMTISQNTYSDGTQAVYAQTEDNALSDLLSDFTISEA